MSRVYRVLQFTDPHLYADPAGEMRGVCTLDTLHQAIAAAQDNHWPPDAILVTGDIAQDESRGAYEIFRDCLAGLDTPVYCLPGNHDSPEFMRQLLDQPPFQYCGHIELGDWFVPMLDAHVPGDAGGRLSDAELARLAELLERHPDRHALVALHHHPVPSRSTWLDTVPLRNPDKLFAVLGSHPQVRCLLWGHVHQYYEDRRDGVLLLATPSTCRQFKPFVEEFALDVDRPPAYRWLDLYPDGTIVTAVHWCEPRPTTDDP